ncbi:c-type cytochrome [Pseudomonas benzenivorans]|uniref:C-type cytochrome n=1 Tax=Pseudomonas benzenivorans TaxID=556533 RepID=A0ABY5HBS3_9PSED|nr:c-type cytochrome [Pseudomonas benzenivorans]UTW09653.1 c-type cytochrome [Pseudomonas benzenivorans]
MRITSAVLRRASALYLAVMTSAALAASDTGQTHAENPTASVTRGKYLVDTSGCHDCHTPWAMGPDGPAPDMSRALSGHPQSLEMPPAPKLPEGPWLVSIAATNTAYAGPWGVSFTANLTPDRETGLGKWTERNFIETIRTGRHLGRGRPVLPPMPVQVYRNMTDGDLAAIYAYLQSIPSVSNRVPAPITPEE